MKVRSESSMQPPAIYHVGLDIGSTTVKAVVMDPAENILFSKYTRHYSEVRECAARLVREVAAFGGDTACRMRITRSGGISLADELGLPFIQEVLTHKSAIRKIPDADAIIELGRGTPS